MLKLILNVYSRLYLQVSHNHEYYNCTLFVCGSPRSKIIIKINTQSPCIRSYAHCMAVSCSHKLGWMVVTLASFSLHSLRMKYVFVARNVLLQGPTSPSCRKRYFLMSGSIFVLSIDDDTIPLWGYNLSKCFNDSFRKFWNKENITIKTRRVRVEEVSHQFCVIAQPYRKQE